MMTPLPLPTAQLSVRPTTTMPTPPTLPTPLTTALIVINVQNALFNPAPRPFEADAVIERINRLTAAARAAGVPVVWASAASVTAKPRPAARRVLVSMQYSLA